MIRERPDDAEPDRFDTPRKAAEPGGIMKILLAYDGFERSRPALEEAAQIAGGEAGANLTTISVVPPDARGSKAGGHVGMAPHAHEDVARAHAYLRERGIPSEMKIAHGDPAEEILREVGEGGYDLLVTGTRGRRSVARLLLGSVSHALTENSPCTVLVVSEDHRVRIEPRTVVEARASG
jgi:nucleotide-binding universal stress UspA family protein